ncbi:MAG TPA: type IV pilus twitching motility protein PilT [Thermoanaerobaculia bacterium]|jgi:twitching motility protein PilT|nr:type IV pilus twitching motility protein PilT [Thermoanaerobaculia bacterium]
MAILDKLLTTASQRRVEAVILEPGRPPCLLRAGLEHQLTGVPLDAPTIARLVAEVAPGEASAASLPAEFDYRIGERTFHFVSQGSGWTAHLATNGAHKAMAAPAPPLSMTSEPELPEPSAMPVIALSTTPDARPLPPIETLLRLLVARGGSDLHLSSSQTPRMRLHGDLLPLPEYSPPAAVELKKLLFAVAPQRNREEFEATNDTDFAVELPGKGRFRANLFREREGIGAVFRQIPYKIPSAAELGLPPVVCQLADLARGLVLVTGPTGSGKSTTLAAILDRVNETRSDHIITIEDPIEFVHPSKGCLVHHREVGSHTGSFERALRAALREDPDVVLVGEMRDLETTAIAIETAETGHLVFGTLHTTTAPSTVDRLIDQYPPSQQAQIRLMLSSSLRAVIAQTLLKKIGGGRIAAYEIMICTPAIANLIREGKTFQIPSLMQIGRKAGMQLLNDSLAKLVEARIVEPREAYLKAVDKDDLLNRFRALGVDPAAVVPAERPMEEAA